MVQISQNKTQMIGNAARKFFRMPQKMAENLSCPQTKIPPEFISGVNDIRIALTQEDPQQNQQQ